MHKVQVYAVVNTMCKVTQGITSSVKYKSILYAMSITYNPKCTSFVLQNYFTEVKSRVVF